MSIVNTVPGGEPIPDYAWVEYVVQTTVHYGAYKVGQKYISRSEHDEIRDPYIFDNHAPLFPYCYSSLKIDPYNNQQILSDGGGWLPHFSSNVSTIDNINKWMLCRLMGTESTATWKLVGSITNIAFESYGHGDHGWSYDINFIAEAYVTQDVTYTDMVTSTIKAIHLTEHTGAQYKKIPIIR